MIWILFLCGSLLLASESTAQVVTETGSLRGMIAGSCPGCAYDNLVTHMAEGIASPGYNSYNPLDPQTNGFGNYTPIPYGTEGDALLSDWKQFFAYMVREEIDNAESWRSEQLSGYPFEIVLLNDTLENRIYYIVRESLDSSYVDLNTPDPDDNEIGSFQYGWGFYVFSPQAAHPRVSVQVVHPNDDYISVYTALDMFFEIDAGRLMLSTVGREVLWTHQGGYNNSKSLSDPSRIERHVFHMAHEAVIDYYVDDVPDLHPFTIQIHSYDTQGRNLSSAICTPGRDDRIFSLPLNDWSGILGGMIDRTPWIVHPAGFIGNTTPVEATEFYGTNSSPRLIVLDDTLTEHQIPDPQQLYGDPGNQQLNYRSSLIDVCTDDEWLFHVECDELPDCIEDSTEEAFYGAGGYPLTWENFASIVNYYHPLASHLSASLDTMAAYMDTEPPATPTGIRLASMERREVTLGWEQSRDPFFYSYRIYYDQQPDIDQNSPYIDRSTFGASALCQQITESFTLTNMQPDEDYWARISGVDRFDQESELSPTIAFRMGIAETYLEILSPNGGEEWGVFQNYSVSWTSNGVAGDVRIELHRDFPDGTWELLTDSTANDGEETVIINGLPSTHCRLRIDAIEDTLSDMSDDDLSIVAEQGYLTLKDDVDPDSPIIAWDAGNQECGFSISDTFRFWNIGGEQIVILQSESPVSSHFSLETDCSYPLLLDPGEFSSCDIILTFNPCAGGFLLDTLFIESDAVNAIDGYVSIPLTGTSTATPLPPVIVLTIEGDDARLAWDPVTESVGGCSVSGLSYQVFYAGDLLSAFSPLGDTSDTTYIHAGVLASDTAMFYYVAASIE